VLLLRRRRRRRRTPPRSVLTVSDGEGMGGVSENRRNDKRKQCPIALTQGP
jgi:hypothetical protein